MVRLSLLFGTLLLAACGGRERSEPLPMTPVPIGEGDIPCDVDQILATSCRSCHAAEPRYGAPMSLVSRDDLLALAKSDANRTVAEVMKVRINDPVAPMPPSGDLPEEELALLDAWLDEGVPAGDGAECNSEEPLESMIGPEHLPCSDPIRFEAHAAGSEAGFHVPIEADNLYQCFTFRSPFAGGAQATAWAPIIDDDRVIHHWILYRTATQQPDGGVMPCQMPSDATFVAGWAPGGTNIELPSDVGLELPSSDQSLILQVHYWNVPRYSDAVDNSGVALCTAETPRPNTAGIYTLGTLRIGIPPGASGWSTSGTCGSDQTRLLPQPVTIIASFPHMHERGRSFRTAIQRADGDSETLIDIPRWDFNSQAMYLHSPPVQFNPGDGITTTCVYDNPTTEVIRFGERTEDEMCFNFVMLHPIELFEGARQCGLF